MPSVFASDAWLVKHHFEQLGVGWREYWYQPATFPDLRTAIINQFPVLSARAQLLGTSGALVAVTVVNLKTGASQTQQLQGGTSMPSLVDEDFNPVEDDAADAKWNSDTPGNGILCRFGETVYGYSRPFWLRGVPDAWIGTNPVDGNQAIQDVANFPLVTTFVANFKTWRDLVLSTFLIQGIQRPGDGAAVIPINNITVDVNGVPTIHTAAPLVPQPPPLVNYVRIARARGDYVYPLRGTWVALNIDGVANTFTLPMQADVRLRYTGFGAVYPRTFVYPIMTYGNYLYYSRKKTGKVSFGTRGRKKRKPLDRTGAPVLYAPG